MFAGTFIGELGVERGRLQFVMMRIIEFLRMINEYPRSVMFEKDTSTRL